MDEGAILTAIGKLQGQMEGMNDRIDTLGEGLGREIKEIKDTLKDESRNCQTCKTDLIGRMDTKAREQDAKIQEVMNSITPIKDQHTGDSAVRAFLDTTLGRICTAVTAFSISAALVALYVWPVVRPVLMSAGGA